MFNVYSLFYPCLSVSSVFEILILLQRLHFIYLQGQKQQQKSRKKNTKANNLSWSFVFDRGLSHAVLVITQLLVFLSSKLLFFTQYKIKTKTHAILYAHLTAISRPTHLLTISPNSGTFFNCFTHISRAPLQPIKGKSG